MKKGKIREIGSKITKECKMKNFKKQKSKSEHSLQDSMVICKPFETINIAYIYRLKNACMLKQIFMTTFIVIGPGFYQDP